MVEWHRWDCPDCGETIVHECEGSVEDRLRHAVEMLEKAHRRPPPSVQWELDRVRSV